MSQSVTIKSNKYGINLVLDADMPFADLIKAVVEKFKASANFFKNAKLAMEHLKDLKDCEAHTSVIISQVDTSVFKKLKINMTCEPTYETDNLYHQ